MTKEVFDKIAPGWYNFRHWSIFRNELDGLAERWHHGSLLNIGCGHGPDFLPFKDHYHLYGVDFSRVMLEHARKYSDKFSYSSILIQADIRNLPFADNSIDHAIAVASYHHIKDKAERLSALQELKRVLTPGGEAFITLWNRWQPRFFFSGNEPAVSWRIQDEVVYRYYYLFSYRRAEKLVKQAGFRLIKSFPESSYRYPVKYFSRNICLLVRKPESAKSST
ncbi:class I SAM-dependent methyltransferase [Chloroflexota bacterium]